MTLVPLDEAMQYQAMELRLGESGARALLPRARTLLATGNETAPYGEALVDEATGKGILASARDRARTRQ